MGLVDKWNKWRDVSKRKNAVGEAISSRNPDTVKVALANISPAEASDDDKSGWLRRAIDEQDAECFKAVLKFTDTPNLVFKIDEGGRYTDYHYYSLLCYALTKARTHDISKMLAGDPRVKVTDDDLEAAKNGGMQDVAAILAGRVADIRRHEADLRQQEAIHLDQEAAAGGAPKAEAPPLPAAPAAAHDGPAETWALMSETSIAHVTASKAIGRKMTEIFNFESKERTLITTNLDTGAETLGAAEKFETVPESAVKHAAEMLKTLSAGGDGQKMTFRL